MQHTQASKQATNPSCIHNSLKDCNARHSLDVVSHLCSHSQWLLTHTVESASDSSWVGHRTGHFSKQHTFPVSGPWTVELFMIIYTLAPDRYTNCGDRSETASHALLVRMRVFYLSTISFHHLFVHFKTKRAIWKNESNISPFINLRKPETKIETIISTYLPNLHVCSPCLLFLFPSTQGLAHLVQNSHWDAGQFPQPVEHMTVYYETEVKSQFVAVVTSHPETLSGWPFTSLFCVFFSNSWFKGKADIMCHLSQSGISRRYPGAGEAASPCVELAVKRVSVEQAFIDDLKTMTMRRNRREDDSQSRRR